MDRQYSLFDQLAAAVQSDAVTVADLAEQLHVTEQVMALRLQLVTDDQRARLQLIARSREQVA